jgi:hypothetical protein
MNINAVGASSLPATQIVAASARTVIDPAAERNPDRASASDEQSTAPIVLHFPWLSRLTAHLETASNRRPAFAAAPALGGQVDASA